MPVGGGSIFYKHYNAIFISKYPKEYRSFSDLQKFLEQYRDFRDNLSQIIFPDFI